MDKKDSISESLDMMPLEVEEIGSDLPQVIETENESKQDYKYARDNFYNVIEKGTEALEQMLEVARVSEHPRAYEVVSTLMKTLVDANKDLVSLSNEKNKKADEKETGNVTNQTAIFVGSTKELQQMLKDMRSSDE